MDVASDVDASQWVVQISSSRQIWLTWHVSNDATIIILSLDCHRRVVYECLVCSVEEQIGIVTHSSISSVIKEQ